ncbi:type I-E CRISPR-associated protein Cse1/CasA [Deinococcus sp. SDU3-2]|uniref:Type I-E CRISPR-associated protein Cse1/CasA n=1 Tax=Deinococcus terrestris TaxID=2651870 RepID=A0A7X1NVG5_9DEIO|nr:type I-E CRISPR-associated protein Cse1/CasA [Deinococcus terrestris]MPY66555.1 type I-E CRISPR-associated protein Cse1/CasA [Deinococcus terrestris]
MDTYPLLDRKWVPVVTLTNNHELVSLCESLLNAASYRRIDAGHPLKTSALYRLHLALLHRALVGPMDADQGAEWYLAGRFPDGVAQYLDRYADRFHLFGTQPFMQVAGLDPAAVGENFRSHWTRLSTEEGSPNTTALFNVEARPGGNRSDALTPAQAALHLLTHQTFALGGLIKRFTTSARAAPVATAGLFLAEGANLHQTLCLNLVPYLAAMQEQDLPPWEDEPLTVEHIRARYDPERPRVAAGYASRYAWPSRSVLLLPEETPQGVVVRSIGFGAGIPLEGAGEGSGTGTDPMVSLRPSRDPKNDQPFPYKLRRERLLWRDMNALLPDPAAQVSEYRKGGVKVKAGTPPKTVSHARDVMRAAAERLGRTGEPKPAPSQNAPNDGWEEEGTPDARAPHPVIPVVVFGQLTDQGKAFAMRQETYTLPEAFIQNPETFRDHVQAALTDAGTVGEGLRRSVHLLAHGLLKKDGDRDPHKDDVGKLAAQIPAEPTYWAGLDTPFRTYLLALDVDTKAALTEWHTALRRAALKGWRTAEQAAGMNAVGLRAVQVAQGPLLKALGTLKNGDTP